MIEKRVASGSGVQNKRPMRKNNKKKWLQKVLDYLKSDSYMFAPLIFHPTNSAAAPGVEMTTPIKEDNRTLLEKVEEYLKSDNYMYAPLIITQPMHVPAAKAIESPQTGYIKSISTDISTRKITKKSSQPTEQQARQQTRRHRVMVKHVVHQNCRSSVLSGKSPISLKP
ncbi:uncharacterized protein LOC117924473 [Vitis riparia]|uniref:uncharacterized protein LOC117924473 n=1 Tax=Vitis riparia TaxID=96939 RepID=UPI00155A96CE|nr:uncharacterized protein LOC117924473 [Vitis riparia]